MKQVNVALIGGGTVGGGVYQALRRNGSLMASRIGVRWRILKVVVKDLQKKRAIPLPAKLLTTNWREVIDDPEIQLIIELVGGTKIAREIALRALKLGKSVVTANKALVSEHGEELFETAELNGSNIYYEASVAGGIPIIKVLREGLIGNRFPQLFGILNGTCNYILSRMSEGGCDFEEALSEAQKLGYAEAEPSLDVDGLDALHKAGILASLAHGFWVNAKNVHVEGIRHITPLDVRFAHQLGYTIKLLASIKSTGKGGNSRKKDSDRGNRINVAVTPALLPRKHVLAGVNGVFNAVYVSGDIVGDTLYYGQGAGQDATASAVLSDLADAALDLKFGTKNRIPAFVPHESDGEVEDWETSISRNYVRLRVIDQPGTMSKVAAVLAKSKIGISSIIQPEGHVGARVPLILMIHDAPNRVVDKALSEIARLDVVQGSPTRIRVEDFD